MSRTLADGAPAGRGHAVVRVDERGIEFALRLLKKTTLANGVGTALRRAAEPTRGGRIKLKGSAARRRRARGAARRLLREQRADFARRRERPE